MAVINSKKAAASVAALLTLVAGSSTAQQREACGPRITRANIVPCAAAASLVVRGERQEMEAAEARRLAASSWLPSNPVLAVSGARRQVPGADATNWYATLSQEVEIAGQRGARREAALASMQAQSGRVLVARRENAAHAWVAYFRALAAEEEQRLADKLAEATEAVSVVARARAEKGLTAPVDADIADATAVRALQSQFEARRRVEEGRAVLSSLLALDASSASLVLDGDLVPLSEAASAAARTGPSQVQVRPEMAIAEAERQAWQLRADAWRRARISNPTVSLFAQNDGFNERVLGAGLSIPIPLPGNVGRTFIGEIAEAEALSRRAATERARVEREIRLQVVNTRQAFASRTAEIEVFTPERTGRAAATLVALRDEVAAGRLGVRDAIVAQQALTELLRANTEARRAWCLASVDLAWALGLPLEGNTR